jgi:hypothetical protein
LNIYKYFKLNTSQKVNKVNNSKSQNEQMSLSKLAIVDKFSELKNKYYVPRGYMISTVNDDVAKNFVEAHTEIEWTIEYNTYAQTMIQTASIHVTIFGNPFTVLLERPLTPVHRCEFEDYFGFGGHCKGFTPYRMIARFASTIEEHGFDFQTLLEENSKENSDNTIDIPYIQDVFKLLVIGGYVKYWKAWDELAQWFIEHADDDESIRTWLQTEFQGETSGENGFSRINKYIFGSM